MIVKVCGITNRDDALLAVEAGASALGFNFYRRSPRYLDPEDAARIVEALPATVWKVGVFVNETPARAAEITRIAGLDIAQLHGDETPEAIPDGVRSWKAMSVGAAFSLGALDAFPVEAFLLDAPANGQYGGTGRSFDWSLARGSRHKIVLAGGLDASNVRAAIETAQPWGVDACSRLESAPGRKDPARVRAFVRAACQ
jgi:phosphoribosylanthranilate isomerase